MGGSDAEASVALADRALAGLRGELAALLRGHPEIKADPHWRGVCEMSRDAADRMREASDALAPREAPEPPDAEERRELVRESLWSAGS